MTWVINQGQSPALLGKSVGRDELATSPLPRVLWLPRLSVPACPSAKEGVLAASPVLEMVGMMGRCGPTSGLWSVQGGQAVTPSCPFPACRDSDLFCSSRARLFTALPPFPSPPALHRAAGKMGQDCVRALKLCQTRDSGSYVPKWGLKGAA